ncbi:hypothetical protein [Deinococcus kurensis]|uniref:hypothetical protein n=1 Tax=Deinococcus kurensis TaxID=2662757 RepID=UPI0012D36A0A|nr:hypothetical protein [Deinococcus kurensis]
MSLRAAPLPERAFVVADVHLGVCSPERLAALREWLAWARTRGTVVWLGDSVDLLRFGLSALDYAPLRAPQDVEVVGNHDYGLSGPRVLRSGGVFMAHGDMVDFGYTAARLQAAREGRGGTLVERLLAHLRPWSVLDVYTFYEVLAALTDEDVAAFEHPSPRMALKKIPVLARVLRGMLRAPVQPPGTFGYLPPLSGGGSFAGYFTYEPLEVLERVLALYPGAADCHTIVIGHLHRQIDELVWHGGREYRVVCLGAWVHPTLGPQFAEVEDGAVVVRPVPGT